jgi:hypothetical protein
MSRIFLLLVAICLQPSISRAAPPQDWQLEFADADQGPPPGVTLQKLIAMTNDRDSSTRTFSLMLGDSGIEGMYLDSSFGNTGNVFYLKNVEEPDGTTVAEAMGKAAVILQGQLDRASQEGRFHLSYLNNAITGDYRRCEFQLLKNGSSWYLENLYNGQRITAVRVTSWTFGISTIEGMCPPDQK